MSCSRRSALGRALDAVSFPLRALFLHGDGLLGLSSLREERMRAVLEHCRGRVLDVGCGPHNLFIQRFVGTAGGSVGIDVYPYPGVENVISDPTRLPFADGSFDTVTLIGVGGHIPRSIRAREFAELARVLVPGGRLVMNEGEPVTQLLLHHWLRFYFGLAGKKDLDSERGMAEDEELCMPRAELRGYLDTPPLRLLLEKRFMWGLNTVYVAEKQAGAP